MNIPRMLEIARDLGELYSEKALHSLNEWQANRDKERRETEITPPDGWPGKNAEQRDAARLFSLHNDPVWAQCHRDETAAHRTVAELDARIEGLSAERRALEFAVRAMLVETLNGNGIPNNHRGAAADHAFENVADHLSDEEIAAQAAEMEEYYATPAEPEPNGYHTPGPDDPEWIPF